MKKYRQIIIISISIFFSSLIWDYINLPFNENVALPGQEYLLNKHNPLNDTLRFIFFITFPLTIYISTKIFYEKKKLNNLINDNSFQTNISDKHNFNISLFFLVLIVFLEFLFLDLTKFIYSIDFFHEGLWLTASFNSKVLHKFWDASYIGRGLFGNFNSLFFWNLFNYESIGITRFVVLASLLLNKVLLIFISYKLTINLNFDKQVRNIFFIILSIILVSLIDYDLNNHVFYLRHFLLLLFLYFVLSFFYSKQNKKIWIIFIGLLSSISMFWYIDIGVYTNLCILFLISILIYKNEKLLIYYLIFSIIFGWSIFIFIIGKSEFEQFLDNTISIFLTIEYIQGLIYPTPFWSKDVRSTRALVLFVITGVFLINILLNNNFKMTSENKFSLLFMYFLALISFKTGLSRSDTPHIKAGLSFLYIPFYFLVILIISNFFLKIDLLKKKFYNLIIFCLFTFFLTKIIFFNNQENKFNNLVNFQNSFKDLIYSKDSDYLPKDYSEFLSYYSELTKDEDCIQIFTNETAIPYFLKKSTCTKYYFVYTASSKKVQYDFISDLMKTKPKFILYKSDKDIYDDPIKRLSLVNKYVLDNYSFFTKFDKWTIKKIN